MAAMMNVQVSLKTAEKGSAMSTIEVRVSEKDTVMSVKEKVAASQLIAFPEHSLVLDGKKMQEAKTMADYRVKDAGSLDFVLEATEDSVVDQLKDLLKTRDLTCDELGLLYCYKHGVSTNQALKTLGCEKTLRDFVGDRKEFVVEAGKVSMVHDGTSLKPMSVAKELETILRENGPTMEITALCGKFIQKFHVSVANIMQKRPLDFFQQEGAFAVLDGRHVCLKENESREKLKFAPQSRSTAVTRPAPQAVDKSTRTRNQTPPRARPVALEQNEELYQDLHTKISSRSFNSRVAQALSTIKEVVESKCFLNVVDVVKGGSVATGTAINDACDAELVFFVEGLPKDGHAKWQAPLLRSVRSVLEMQLSAEEATDIICTENSVRLTAKNFLTVDLRFSPVFGSYAATVQALGRLGPHARKPYEPSFVKERTQFVTKQPGHVKVTIRLLKWWRDQQSWSCALTRPSDAILELVAIYVAQQCGKTQQAQMIANCMSVLARFDQLRVEWSNIYDKSDAWAPLMLQKPLLMDPVNPFNNVADPQDFDAREMRSLAAKTHFFW